MLGINVKRGVESTFERVYTATGAALGSYRVIWTGGSAGVARDDNGVLNTLLMPNLDDNAEVPMRNFHNLIGYAIHELGHMWFTDNRPWTRESERRGKFFHSLVNGLEDPRIEMKVIKSGYAPNSGQLFETLINDILRKGGYPEPDDFANIPFMLAVEGRRLNGYNIITPSNLSESPYGAAMLKALNAAHLAVDTDEIVRIAIRLHDELQQVRQEQQQEQQQEQGEQGEQDEQQGEQQDGQQDGQDGQDGQDQQNGKKKGEPREVEPREFIEQENETVISELPTVGKLTFDTMRII